MLLVKLSSLSSEPPMVNQTFLFFLENNRTMKRCAKDGNHGKTKGEYGTERGWRKTERMRWANFWSRRATGIEARHLCGTIGTVGWHKRRTGNFPVRRLLCSNCAAVSALFVKLYENGAPAPEVHPSHSKPKVLKGSKQTGWGKQRPNLSFFPKNVVYPENAQQLQQKNW